MLSNNHWKIESYKQRVTKKQWRDYLLENDGIIIVKGRLRKLKAKKVFGDLYDIYKEVLDA